MHITDEQLAHYKKDGFLIIDKFLTENERKSAIDGFYKHFAPPYHRYIENNRENDTPKEVLFPWDHTGLNHVTTHPDLIHAAERVLGTREIRLGEGHLGMKYAQEEHWTNFHIDYGNNTLGPIIQPDDFMHLACFYCFEDVTLDLAPIFLIISKTPNIRCSSPLASIISEKER